MEIGAFIGAAQHVGMAFGAGGGPARTISSVVVGALSSFTLPVTITADAANGETVKWVLVPTAAAAPTAANVAAGQANGGGAPTDAGSFTWPSGTATLVSGIARANYDLYVVIDNGNLSNVGAPASDFEVDTTAPLLTDQAFTDDGAEGVDGEFTANEAVSYRASLWADGSTPSAAQIESGTGSVATLTGTAAAATLETFNFPAVGDGIYVPTLWVQDDYGNEYSEIYADVPVAVADPLASDAGRLYRYEIGTMTRSGSDVVTAPDGTPSPVNLTSTPAAFDAPTQASGTAPAVFSAAASPGPTLIQSATLDAANRKIRQHLAGGGSNAIRVFEVVDAATLSTNPAAFFAETNQSNENNAIAFGAYQASGNFRFFGRIRNNVGADFVSILTLTSDPVASLGRCIVEYHITQTTWEVFLDGVSKATGTCTPANLPAYASARVMLGAIADTTSNSRPATGSFFEIFITGTTDSTFAATVRAYLAAKYGT